MTTLSAAAATASSTHAIWTTGRSDENTVQQCQWPYALQPGTTATVGQLAGSAHVPKVGQVFYTRVLVALLGFPCGAEGYMVPEFVPPAGVSIVRDAKHPVRWSFTKNGRTTPVSTKAVFGKGQFGGLAVDLVDAAHPNGTFWNYDHETGVLEIQVPMVAHRALHGIATRAPNCRARDDGDAPCPVAMSGDHLQVFVYTADPDPTGKRHLVPYVGLYAQKSTPKVSASFNTSSGHRGTARIALRAAALRPTGRISVYLGKKRLATTTLGAKAHGRKTLSLPALRAGKHHLTVRYSGSTQLRRVAKAYWVTTR